MNDFLLFSIVGSVLLTIALNLLPMLFPRSADKLQRKIEKNARKTIEQHEYDEKPKVKVFFPWKVMLLSSIVLTVLVNLVSYFSH